MADLVQGSSSGLVSKLEPKVTSLARPSVDFLLQARADIQHDPALQALFREHKDNPEHLTDQLTARLAGLWGGDFANANEAARYLADEYAQIGEGILIVSSETGKAIAKLSEEDIYQPAPVLRESGNLAEPLPRIEPGLEGMIVSWVFEKAREERIEAILAERAHQTALLREEGDKRLWIATRTGRGRLAKAIGEDHPLWLLGRSGGSSGAFLNHFDLTLEAPPQGTLYKDYLLDASVAIRVHDPLTTNLRHDRLGTMRGVIAQGWVRDLAKKVSEDILRFNSQTLPVRSISDTDITKDLVESHETWVMDPDVMLAFMKTGKRPMIPVNNAPTLGLSGKIGTVVVPDTFDLQQREVFGRWEVLARLRVRVWLQNLNGATSLDTSGVTVTAQVL